MNSLALFSLESLLILIAIALSIPILVLFFECVTASLTQVPQDPIEPLKDSVVVAVLVPAHNEADGIAAVLAGIQSQLRAQDRLLVVADNCTDETATVARQVGAEVVERVDPERRGKGYALDFGLRALASQPPDVVVMMDADCRVTAGTLLQLAAKAIAAGRPTQAIYLFETPESPSSKALISAFAIKVKNWVRPLGLWRLGWPSLLLGTGMAFPWSALQSVDLASGHIVEDMKLGFDLAIAGHPPVFCPTVRVMGQLPESKGATTSQRTRWEHGHLQVLGTYLPRLFWQAVRQQRGDLLALGLDLSIPPLSLLVMLWAIALPAVMLVGTLQSTWEATYLLGIGGCLLGLSIGTAWLKFSRDDLPFWRLVSVILYLLWKIPIYIKFSIKPESSWIRTQRRLDRKKTDL